MFNLLCCNKRRVGRHAIYQSRMQQELHSVPQTRALGWHTEHLASHLNLLPDVTVLNFKLLIF